MNSRQRLQHGARCWSSVVLSVAVLGVSTEGCRGTDSRSVEETTRATDMTDMPNMPNMPGMAETDSSDTGSVALTAAQVAQGRIKWAVVTSGSSGGAVEIPGQLVPDEDRTARLAAPAEARVLRVHVSPGDRVARGGRLVTLQSQDASTAVADVAKGQADVASRRAAAVYAKAARDRAERLLALKAIPRQEYERAVADDELARAALAQAEAELRRARAGAEQLGVDLQSGFMVLRSPIAGFVTTREVVPGAVVSAGTPLVTVTDPVSLWLTAALPEQLAGGVNVGSALRFTVAPYPVDTFHARVQSVSAAFDPVTRSLPIRGVVSNSEGRLRPEMFAKVWVQGASRESSVTVPDAAVQRLDGKTVVFVAHPDGSGGGHFEAREVSVASSGGGRAAIVRGVVAGEMVVVQGAYAVKAEIVKAKMPEMEM
jgi:cobalt-zinc-cadmium efflux system membrane fusion protein